MIRTTLIIVSILFFSCEKQKDGIGSVEEQKTFFDLSNLEDRLTNDPMAELDRYIILDNSDGNIVGSIDKLIVHDNRFYILDKKMNLLHCYDQDGKFIEYVGRVGSGPGEYSFLQDFTIDKEGNFHILDLRTPKILKYGKDYSFLSESRFPYYATSFTYLGADEYAFKVQNIPGGTVSSNNVIFWSSSDGGLNEFLPVRQMFDHPEIIQFNRHSMSSSSSHNLLYLPFEYSFYEVTKEGIMEKYAIEFGSAEINADYFPNFQDLNSVNDQLISIMTDKIDKVYGITGYFETDYIFTFRFSRGAELYYFVYDKVSGKYKVKKSSDFSDELSVDITAYYADQRAVYGVVHPIVLQTLKDDRRKESIKKITRDSELEFVESLPDEPNPVIVKYSFVDL